MCKCYPCSTKSARSCLNQRRPILCKVKGGRIQKEQYTWISVGKHHEWLIIHSSLQATLSPKSTNARYIKGTTIWFWGGGGLALLVGTDYFISSRARPENLFRGKSRTEYLFSTATNFLKSKKKKNKKKKRKPNKQKKEGGGVLERGLSRGRRTWLSMFGITFCRLLACNI